jgi:hypothetical protein
MRLTLSATDGATYAPQGGAFRAAYEIARQRELRGRSKRGKDELASKLGLA